MSLGDGTGAGVVMTFNVGRGATGPRGTDQADLGRVAEVLAADGGVDVACLQEVHGADVPLLCAALRHDHGLDHHAHFTPTVPAATMARSLAAARARGDERRAAHLLDRQSDFGIAVLSRSPLTSATDHVLPDDRREPRAAQVVATRVGGAPVTVVNTHLGLVTDRRLRDLLLFRPAPQRAQTRTFLDLASRAVGPVVAAGDLNQVPTVLSSALAGRDLVVATDTRRPTCGRRTIDFVLTGHGASGDDPEVRPVPVSDHDPVVVHLTLPT